MTCAIVLAGGLGTRLRSVVADVPKPMAEVRGRPFLEHLLDYWLDQGVDSFVLSVGYQRQSIIDHFGAVYRGCPVTYAIEETPLGTGGGLLVAAAQLRDSQAPFLLLNGDTFFDVDLDKLIRFHEDHGSLWTFSLFRANEAGRYMGMDVAPDGRIVSLKSGAGTPGRLANGGVYAISPAVSQLVPYRTGERISLEDDLLSQLLAQGCALYGMEHGGTFIDIGVPDDYFRAAELLPG